MNCLTIVLIVSIFSDLLLYASPPCSSIDAPRRRKMDRAAECMTARAIFKFKKKEEKKRDKKRRDKKKVRQQRRDKKRRDKKVSPHHLIITKFNPK